MSQKSSAPKKSPGPWIHSVCASVRVLLTRLIAPYERFLLFLFFFLSMRRSSQSCQASGRSMRM